MTRFANTAFRHKSRHLTTRTGWVKDWADPSSNQSKSFFSMSDFVVCRHRFISTLVTLMPGLMVALKDSDHKLVCARFQFRNRHLTFPQRAKSDYKFDCNTLSANPAIQVMYSTKLSELIKKRSAEDENYEDAECNARMDNLVSSIKLDARSQGRCWFET